MQIHSLIAQHFLLHAFETEIEKQFLQHCCIRVEDFAILCGLMWCQQLAAS